jgi:anti-sigma-K factor RskA
MKRSWKTSTAGIAAAIAAIAGALNLVFDGNAATNPDWTAVIAAVVAGVGLAFARDNTVTSEDVGAK